MPDLPEAEKEAKTIANALGGPPYVTLLAGVDAGPEQVTRQLFTEAWEIIHISAHGVSNQLIAGPDGKKKRRTGIVLGDGAVLDSSALAKIPVSPGIVFINCCHLAVGPVNLEGRPEFAANVAIDACETWGAMRGRRGMGDRRRRCGPVRRGLLRGDAERRDLREATLLARQAAYRVDPNSSTFGAYQCYGDPDFRLRVHNKRGPENGRRTSSRSPRLSRPPRRLVTT